MGALGNYGGDTLTIPLLPGSPALNAGDTATCETTDQRGLPRVGMCDLGAFESQGFTLTLTGGDNQSTLIGTSFAHHSASTWRRSSSSEPISGGVVNLITPSSGASLSGTLTIDAAGVVSAPIVANDQAGSYGVTATVGSTRRRVALNFTNLSPDLTISKTVTPTTFAARRLDHLHAGVCQRRQLAASNVTSPIRCPAQWRCKTVESTAGSDP